MTVIECEPVYGSGPGEPCCYVLRVEEVWVLLDCGWDESFDLSLVEPLKEVGPRCTMVLLSHFDLRHAGALPFLVKHCGLTAPVFCVEPTFFMGQWSLLDAFTSAVSRNAALRAALTARDIVDAFAWCTRCRYDQPLVLPPAASDLTVDALPAGRLLGGAIWRLRRDVEEIVYAVDFSHEGDRFLSEAATRSISHGAVVITDASQADMKRFTRSQRDHLLLEGVLHTLRGGGDVLLPCDTGGRVLELLLVLDQEWMTRRIDYPIVFASPAAADVLRSASQLLSWMHPALVEQLSQRRHNVFDNIRRRVRVASTAGEALTVRSPKVVLATSANLGTGLAHALLPSWLERPSSTIVLTARGAPGSLARTLTDAAMRRRAAPALKIRRVKRVAGAQLERPARGEAGRAGAARSEGEDGAEAEGEGAAPEEEEDDGEEEGGEGAKAQAGDAAKRHSGEGAGAAQSAEKAAGGEGEEGAGALDLLGVSARVRTARVDLTDGNQRCAFPTFPVAVGPRGVSAYGEELDYIALIRAARATEVSRATPGTSVLQRVQEEELARGGGATRTGVLRVGQASTDGGQALRLAETAERAGGSGQAEEVEVALRCGVRFVPMDGTVDGQSLRVLLAKLEPKAVVLTQQPPGGKFAEELADVLAATQVVPLEGPGAPSQVHTETQTVPVLVHPSFVGAAAQQKVGEYTLAVSGPGVYAMGQAPEPGQESLPLLRAAEGAVAAVPNRPGGGMEEEDEDEDEEDGEDDGSAAAAAAAAAAARPAEMPVEEMLRALAAPSVMARRQELPLRRMRGMLAAAGVEVEMQGGKLYTATGVVVTRKGDEGLVSLEGPPTDEFFRVRELLLSKYVLV